MALGSRAIARIEGAAGGGFAKAKKIAELYVSTNTNDAGVVKNPEVYQSVIENILKPYAGTVDGQNLIASYINKSKKLTTANNKSETTVAALKEKEYASWYVDDDSAGDTSFRNPAWVAQVTSESLDMIVAETSLAIIQARDNNESTAELNQYLNGLITRSDRMRSVSGSLNDGVEASLDGYGYFVDSDPNTGEIRGASFMPTDQDFGGLATNKKRTNSTITVGNKSVPVYLPFVTDDQGIEKSQLGGVTYEYDGTNLYASGQESLALSDRNAYQGAISKIQLGQVYQTFNGKVNIDGSFKRDYVYVGNDNTIYKFGDDNLEGQKFLKSMREAGNLGENVLRLNPADVADFPTQPLPSDTSNLSYSEGRSNTISRYQREGAALQAESDRLQSLSPIGEVVEGAGELVSKGVSAVKGFFSRKNVPAKQEEPGQSISGQSSGVDVVDSGRSFFAGKVT